MLGLTLDVGQLDAFVAPNLVDQADQFQRPGAGLPNRPPVAR